MVRFFAVSILLSVLGLSGGAEAGRQSLVHVVEMGQTLWGISRSYGCGVEEIKAANELSGQNLIRPGQKLTIPTCTDTPSKSASADPAASLVLTHHVEKGDTLGAIARRYDTTVEDIRQRNGLTGNLIRLGQKLRVSVGKGGEGRAIAGQSVGLPSRGSLANAMQLPPGQGYYRRRPHRAWGANHTIYHIRRAVSEVRSKLPRVHSLAIGDISARKGGRLAQHKSHQSGLDADIGLYFKKRPDGYPRSFVRANKSNLDFAATWALLKAFADTADSPSGVDKMFLDYELQELMYKWAKKEGVSQKILDAMFQYPHGQSAGRGLIRHDPGHDSHVHVRFKCPRNDKSCG